MKRGYFIGLAFSCAVLMLGCTNREKDQTNDPDAPIVTDSTGLTEGDAEVAGQNTEQTEETTDAVGQSDNTGEGTADTAGRTADVTGQTAVSAEKNMDSSGAASADQIGDQTGSANQSGEIGIEAAKKIALEKVGLNEQDGFWKEEKRDQENGRIVYELEFVSGTIEYEFEIDAQRGTILKYQQDLIND